MLFVYDRYMNHFYSRNQTTIETAVRMFVCTERNLESYYGYF